jgi:tripartite-type tricarboxylate transporter receptor subunit TctC
MGVLELIADGMDNGEIAGRPAASLPPTGMPKEIVDVLNAAGKKFTDTDEHKKRMEEFGETTYYIDPADFEAHWADTGRPSHCQ